MSGPVLPALGRFSVEKQESLLKLSILSISAVLAFSTRLFSVLRSVHCDLCTVWPLTFFSFS